MGILRNRYAKSTGESLALLTATLALLIFAAGCAGGETSSAEPGNGADRQAGETTDGASQRQGETTDEANTREDDDGQVVAGDATVRSDGEVSGPGVDGGEDDGSSGGTDSEATLRMEGDAGTTFSGSCTLGKKEMDVSGEVPARFDLQLDGRKVECEIRKEGEGLLRMVLESGNSRNVYQTTSSNATVKLTYSGDGVASFSASSSGSSSSVTQHNSSSSVVVQKQRSP